MNASELIKSQLANCHAIKTHTIYGKIGWILLIQIKVYKGEIIYQRLCDTLIELRRLYAVEAALLKYLFLQWVQWRSVTFERMAVNSFAILINIVSAFGCPIVVIAWDCSGLLIFRHIELFISFLRLFSLDHWFVEFNSSLCATSIPSKM